MLPRNLMDMGSLLGSIFRAVNYKRDPTSNIQGSFNTDNIDSRSYVTKRQSHGW